MTLSQTIHSVVKTTKQILETQGFMSDVTIKSTTGTRDIDGIPETLSKSYKAVIQDATKLQFTQEGEREEFAGYVQVIILEDIEVSQNDLIRFSGENRDRKILGINAQRDSQGRRFNTILRVSL